MLLRLAWSTWTGPPPACWSSVPGMPKLLLRPLCSAWALAMSEWCWAQSSPTSAMSCGCWSIQFPNSCAKWGSLWTSPSHSNFTARLARWVDPSCFPGSCTNGGAPKTDGSWWRISNRWMIWRFHHFTETPCFVIALLSVPCKKEHHSWLLVLHVIPDQQPNP